MKSVIVLCGLLCLGAAQQVGNDNDDGSYNPAKYEDPYKHTEKEDYQDPQGQYQPQQQQYQPQQYYQPQAPRAPAPVYQSQPQYQPQQPQNYVTDPKNAAILSEQRYLNGDGKFGASYTQDDGVTFKEEASPDGTRKGSYSYVDPSGQRRTVSYTAGKDGFVPVGDHLPVGPAPAAPAAPAPAYQPQQQYQQPAYQPQQYQPQQFPQPQQANSIPAGQYSFDSRY